MSRKSSVIDTVMPSLKSYLDEKQSKYESQSETNRSPTLPNKQEGEGCRVNIRQVAKDLETAVNKPWVTIENYLKNRDELKIAINLVAQAQGLQQIGERGTKLPGAAGKAEQRRDQALIESRRDASDSKQAAANNALINQSLQVELAEKEEQLRRAEDEIRSLQAQIDAMKSGHFFHLE